MSREVARELGPNDLERSAGVLARAFETDPGMTFIFPDPSRRLNDVQWFLGVVLRHGNEHGTVLGTSGLEGVAVCLPPGHVVTPESMGRAGMDRAAETLDAASLERMDRLSGTLAAMHAGSMTEPHWQLSFLGVEPPAQGRGFGATLVDALSERADADGAPCYLDTLTQENVAFYTNRGYAVIAEDDIPGSGVHAWGMARPPR